MKDAIFVLDGYGLIYRAYFAFIGKPLTDKDGNNISALHGFFRTLFALIENHDARNLIVALDSKGPTFRHQMYDQYKANRDSAPQDLHPQLPLIEEMLEFLGIPAMKIDGFEADDIMGSIARYCREKDIDCRLVSGDKDLMQLVGGSVTMLRPEKHSGFKSMDEQAVLEEKGVRPYQIADYLALIGDSSDNIPGVAGIGPKTAANLLSQWNTLDKLYDNLDKAAKGSKLGKLVEGRQDAFMSRRLTTIHCDLEVDALIEQISALKPDYQAALNFLRDRGMKHLETQVAKIFNVDPVLDFGNPVDANNDPDMVASGFKPTCSAILTMEGLETWKKKILETKVVALDTETDNINPMLANLVGLSVCVGGDEAAYIPLRRPDGPCLQMPTVIGWLDGIFGTDSKIKIIGQNFKYDLKVLRRAGLPLAGCWFDTMIAAWLLDTSMPVGMDALAERYLNYQTISFSSVVPKGKTFVDVPIDQATDYAAEDAWVTYKLHEKLVKLLDEDQSIRRIFYEYEMPLLPILAGMEMEGIAIDNKALEQYAVELGKAIEEIRSQVYALCNKEFNIASPKQLQQVLFDERGLTATKKTKTGYSTDNSVLTELARIDPVAQNVLQYRALTKLKSTYVDVLPKLAHPEDGRIHTSYSQTGAATGRLSSNDPNLQNIPIRDENGRRIRKAFVSRAGHLFVSADYSQIELVVLAHISGDKALCQAFRNSVDVHSQTAALLYSVAIDQVTPEQRRMAKAVNFGVMYGMSAFRLSNEMRISRKEAQHFIEAYFSTYSGINQYIQDTQEIAREHRGVRTLYGRFRPIPGINSRNRVEQAAAQRMAVNTRIQGTAADIMKASMIAVDKLLAQRYPQVKMLLQVHDELLVEAPQDQASQVAQDIKQTMENSAQLNVPLVADVEVGPTWGDIH